MLPTRSRRTIVAVVIVAAIVLAGVLVVGYSPFHLDALVDPLVRRALARLQGLGAPPWVDYFFVDFLANIVFFVPVGLIAALLLPRRRWWLAIPTGVALSCCIELGQLLFLPGRDASITDVLANSLGATAGAVVGRAMRRAARPANELPEAPRSARR